MNWLNENLHRHSPWYCQKLKPIQIFEKIQGFKVMSLVPLTAGCSYRRFKALIGQKLNVCLMQCYVDKSTSDNCWYCNNTCNILCRPEIQSLLCSIDQTQLSRSNLLYKLVSPSSYHVGLTFLSMKLKVRLGQCVFCVNAKHCGAVLLHWPEAPVQLNAEYWFP